MLPMPQQIAYGKTTESDEGVKLPINGLRTRKPRVKAEIVTAMARSILTGEVEPGSFMPTETELCMQYGVSRTVIREVTKVLESKGLLSIRSRIGTQVQEKTLWNLLDPDMIAWAEDFSEQPEYVASLMEMRRIIEPAAAELAALRASDKDIAKLQDAFERMAAFQGNDAARSAEADADFHHMLLVATQNHVLVQLGRIIGRSLKALLLRTAQAGSRPQYSLELHGEIVTAIRARDPKLARRAIMTIIEDSCRDLGV